jgi:hypothetical protein
MYPFLLQAMLNDWPWNGRSFVLFEARTEYLYIVKFKVSRKKG